MLLFLFGLGLCKLLQRFPRTIPEPIDTGQGILTTLQICISGQTIFDFPLLLKRNFREVSENKSIGNDYGWINDKREAIEKTIRS